MRHEQFSVNNLSVTQLLDPSGYILQSSGTTVPTDGTAGYAKGCIFIDTDVGAGSNGVYINVGTTAACNFDVQGTISALAVTTGSLAANAVTSGKLATGILQVDSIALVRADIIHATPIKELVAAPAAGYFLEFISATVSFKFGTAAYAGGGNVSVAYHGGAAISTVITKETGFNIASGANINTLAPTGAIIPVVATALDLITATQFTDVGTTATGAALVTVAYRVLPIQA